MSGQHTEQHRLPGLDILIGIFRVGTGKPDGIAMFGSSVGHFTASLAPFIALPLVGTAIALVAEPNLEVIADLLATWCGLLAPAVLTWELARKWRRDACWLRYATAFNWCMWAIPVVAFLLLLIIGVLLNMGVPNEIAAIILPIGLGGYALWLHWFLARHGLQISRGRAVLVVILVNLMTSALVLAPVVLEALINPAPSP